MKATVTLSELNAMVGNLLRYEFAETFLLKTEISELRVAAGGHCYLAFVEQSEDGTGLAARASAHIWRGTYPAIRKKFEQITGEPLRTGLQVLVEVGIEFHPLYGYSLNVIDIDPSYTLGDTARRRKEIIDRLQADGVADMNKELSLPRLLRRIAVISSATAAGFDDFQKQLEGCGYIFHTTLFEAVMQGTSTAASIISALGKISLHEADFDCVVIIRGGGAVSDLQGFENYELACHVAQFPLPVLTGIGHERDDTVVDFVAHTRLKTPTATAEFLVESRRREAHLIDRLSAKLSAQAQACLDAAQSRQKQLRLRLNHTAVRTMDTHRKNLELAVLRIRSATVQIFQQERLRLTHLDRKTVSTTRERLATEHHRLCLFHKSIDLADPIHILKLGYSIARTSKGRAVRSAGMLKPGARLHLQFGQGTATVAVRSVTQSPTSHEK